MAHWNEAPLRKALKATGLPWSIEPGSKHLRVFLAGQQVAVMSRGSHARRHSLGFTKIIHSIERAAEGIRNGQANRLPSHTT